MGAIILIGVLVLFIYLIAHNPSESDTTSNYTTSNNNTTYIPPKTEKPPYKYSFSREGFPLNALPQPNGDHYEGHHTTNYPENIRLDRDEYVFSCKWRGDSRCAYCFRRDSKVENSLTYYGESRKCLVVEYLPRD